MMSDITEVSCAQFVLLTVRDNFENSLLRYTTFRMPGNIRMCIMFDLFREANNIHTHVNYYLDRTMQPIDLLGTPQSLLLEDGDMILAFH